MQKEKLNLFNDKSVRTIWSEEHEINILKSKKKYQILAV